MERFYDLAADVLLVVHFAYVAFVVLGFLAIIAGLTFRRPWATSPLLRWSHLIAILIVAGESMLGITCPLTVWEQSLRRLAGRNVESSDFIAHWLHSLLFFELPTWVFSTIYISFGVLVLVVFLRWPPAKRTSTG